MELKISDHMIDLRKKKIWIDLDNSPHVPFFKPIIKELEKRGYSVVVTARDCFQVCGLADLLDLKYSKIGRHYGKNKVLKVIGLVFRALQLAPKTLRERPIIGLSHGSRSQVLITSILKIPSVLIFDYEFVKVPIRPTWIIGPEAISDNAVKFSKDRFLKYPGIKEDVYVPYFEPDANIKRELGIDGGDIIVTVRPPATEAHYHNPKSEELFKKAIDFVGNQQDTKIIILPRNNKQKGFIKRMWPEWCANHKIIIPEYAVDGLNLIWHSDFVISGGGTMNREAAALGVPVYSIFKGKIGSVDRYLSAKGRLTLIENGDQLYSKILLAHRNKSFTRSNVNTSVLQKIVSYITNIVENHSNRLS
jgi:predicted glycosyltransferase